MSKPADQPTKAADDRRRRQAAGRLLNCYQELAADGQHLLHTLLQGKNVNQWEHLPEEDAVDESSGYQWFYHCHSPDDRGETNTLEHGHFHVFARTTALSKLPERFSKADELHAIASLENDRETRHLLCISLDAKGIPIEIFTVNSWVTGDTMVDARSTAWLLKNMTLETGHRIIDAVLESVVALLPFEISEVLAIRDGCLLERMKAEPEVLENRTLEVLSSKKINIDDCLGTFYAEPSS